MNKKALFLLFLLIFLISCKPKQNQVCFEQNCFNVELAVTEEEQNKGLSDRGFLEQDKGMLYIFENESIYKFWMKDMLIPIDIVWVDSNFTVVDMMKNARPCNGPVCLEIVPEKEAKYVLEFSNGTSEKINLTLDSKFLFKLNNITI